MPTETYVPLAEVTLVTSADFVNFTSISQDYSDLVLQIEVFSIASGNRNNRVRANGDSTSTYSNVVMRGDGTTASSFSQDLTYARIDANSSFTNTTKNMATTIFADYSATDKHKTILSRSSSGLYGVDAIASRWPSTAAITSLTVFPTSSEYAAGSTFKLFGIHGEVV